VSLWLEKSASVLFPCCILCELLIDPHIAQTFEGKVRFNWCTVVSTCVRIHINNTQSHVVFNQMTVYPLWCTVLYVSHKKWDKLIHCCFNLYRDNIYHRHVYYRVCATSYVCSLSPLRNHLVAVTHLSCHFNVVLAHVISSVNTGTELSSPELAVNIWFTCNVTFQMVSLELLSLIMQHFAIVLFTHDFWEVNWVKPGKKRYVYTWQRWSPICCITIVLLSVSTV
jgi:hypothetical protein